MLNKRLPVKAFAKLLCGLTIVASQAAGAANFDFDYAMSGEKALRPMQVFDDGGYTYLQFVKGATAPAILVPADKGGLQLVIAEEEGPYLKIKGVHSQVVLRVGKSEATVVHANGSRPGDRAVLPAKLTIGGVVGQRLEPNGAERDLVDDAFRRNSYATPVKGDRVAWDEGHLSVDRVGLAFDDGSDDISHQAASQLRAIARRAAPGTVFRVTAADDASLKEGLERLRAEKVRRALVVNGVPASNIIVRTVHRPKGGQGQPEVLVTAESVNATAIATPYGSDSASGESGFVAAIQKRLTAGTITYEQAVAEVKRGPAPVFIEHDVRPEGGFLILPEDKTIGGTLRRWADEIGYDVLWNPAVVDPPVSGQGVINAKSLVPALSRLFGALEKQGYKARVDVYRDKVILVSPDTPAGESASATASPLTSPSQGKVGKKPVAAAFPS